jgi:putative nucleotidyltransferase with HDIG domain
MASHTQALLSPPQEGYGLRPGALWTHSVAVALAAQAVAKRLRLLEKGVLFTAGLLHDVGKVLLNEYVATEYEQIAARVSQHQLSFIEAEQQILGFTHPEIGGRVAERWGLPEPIQRCIRHHHEPDALSLPDPLVDTIHLADAVCLLMGLGGGDESLLYRAQPAVVARYALATHDIESIGAEVVVELKAVEALFHEDEGP